MHPEEDPDEVDQSYRDAFSGLFGEEPEESLEPEEAKAPKASKAPERRPDPSPEELDENAMTGELAGLLPPASILPPAPLEAPAPEKEPEFASSVQEALGEKKPEERFDAGEETRSWVSSGHKSPSGSWLDLQPEGEDETATVQRKEEHDDLGHGGEEQTRAMSADDVDDVLRDMERRVRELHGEAGHDTVVDLQAPPTPAPAPEPASVPADPGQPPASTAAMLETWIRKNVTTTGVHFEHVGAPEAPLPSTRRGAALEIGDTHIRYLELEPRPSGDLVATRYEQVALAESSGTSVEERAARITAGLAALQQRTGKLAPCTVHFEQGAVFTRLLTLPAGTRRVDLAVNEAIASSEPLAADKRVAGVVRVGAATAKSVLTSYGRQSEISRLEEALRATSTPALRVTSAQVSFLEIVVPAAARRDEDAAEAFVLVERRQLTVALAARGVLLLVLVIHLEQEPGTQDYVDEVLAQLKKASEELERACGGGELARVRHLIALPSEAGFPSKEVVVAFGRPAEMIDPELLFRIELESVQKLAVPTDAMSLLAPAAHWATQRGAVGLDLVRRTSRRTVVGAWAAAAAVLVAALGTAISWEPRADERRQLDETIAGRLEQVHALEPAKNENADAVRIRDARRALEDDRKALDAFEASAPDPEVVLSNLAALKLDDVFYEAVHLVRDGARRERWQVDLDAVAVGDKEKGPALGSDLVARAKASPLTEVAPRPETPKGDEYPITISARAGGTP
ncbi:MAG TPA: hypothetical protein VFF73_30310 [Planctomycetota bacterium]|nr:hypothetical protein [Planctomycetota bacterium]